MRRQRGLLSQIHSTIGSITHWTFRFILQGLFKVLRIEASEGVERWLAYVLTGVFLIWMGVWSYFKWW